MILMLRRLFRFCCHLLSSWDPPVGDPLVPSIILWADNPRPREGKGLAHDHTASQWQSQDKTQTPASQLRALPLQHTLQLDPLLARQHLYSHYGHHYPTLTYLLTPKAALTFPACAHTAARPGPATSRKPILIIQPNPSTPHTLPQITHPCVSRPSPWGLVHSQWSASCCISPGRMSTPPSSFFSFSSSLYIPSCKHNCLG